MTKRLLVLLIALNTAFFPISCTRTKEMRTLDDMIAEIGEVSLASEGAIEEAEAALEALPEEEQEKLKGRETLTRARETLDRLKAEALDAENRETLAGTWTELADALPLQGGRGARARLRQVPARLPHRQGRRLRPRPPPRPPPPVPRR